MHEVWAFEHSIGCAVTRKFAWRFWTAVENWKLDSDIESVELHGPFAAGSEGVTHTRSAGPIAWRLVHVVVEAEAVLEVPGTGCVGRFLWTFADLGDSTRITQRASIGGEGAQAIADAIAPGLESGIPAGMRRLCESMARAAAGAG